MRSSMAMATDVPFLRLEPSCLRCPAGERFCAEAVDVSLRSVSQDQSSHETLTADRGHLGLFVPLSFGHCVAQWIPVRTVGR